ncbi:MAG: YbaB/EbfC family nucleoid-associated protein [Candidatus Doudnabacteria bacterium]|nr:YbaB/EbfC family nucleoid-associated protein [Candidatus Doudnabacteria bacterium]
MFGQMKDLYNLQKQARDMKKQLESEQISGSSTDGKITLTINGSYELLSVKVSPDAELSPSEIEDDIKQAYENANDQLKKILMEKFKGMM